MRLRYHEIIGLHVVTSDGRDVGQISDLRAEPVDGKLRVTHLLVGPRALVERVARRAAVTEVPWRLVRRVGERVELRVSSAELNASPGETDG